MWIVYATISAVLASLVAIFGKIGLREVDPTVATIVRSVIMASVLVLGGFVFRKIEGFTLASLSSKAWVYIVLSALAGALSWVAYFLALKYGPASSVAVIDKMSVVLVVLFAGLFLGEALTLKSSIGLVMIVAGSLLVLFK